MVELTLIGMNVLVVFTLIRLGRRGEDWLRELFGFLQTGRHRDSMDSLTLLIFVPSGS